jgi:hypothetical protein
MDSHRSLDLAGILQLVGSAAVFAVIAGSIAALSVHADPLPAIVIAVVAAVVGVVVRFWEWERLGGRVTVVAVNSWIRHGAIPSVVSPDVWMPLLRQREARASKRWGLVVLAGIEMPLSILMISSASATTETVLWWCALGFWAVVAVWAASYNLRLLPVIRSLLRHTQSVDAFRTREDEGARSGR